MIPTSRWARRASPLAVLTSTHSVVAVQHPPLVLLKMAKSRPQVRADVGALLARDPAGPRLLCFRDWFLRLFPQTVFEREPLGLATSPARVTTASDGASARAGPGGALYG